MLHEVHMKYQFISQRATIFENKTGYCYYVILKESMVIYKFPLIDTLISAVSTGSLLELEKWCLFGSVDHDEALCAAWSF